LGFPLPFNKTDQNRAPGIVIDATGDQVYLSASDLETASKSHFQAEIKDPGKVLVPGKLLAEISRALPNKPER